MKRYVFTRWYKSHVGEYQAGQVVELEAERAAWFNRDSPGVLREVPAFAPAPAPGPEPEARVMAEPPQDRMVRQVPRKRGRR